MLASLRGVAERVDMAHPGIQPHAARAVRGMVYAMTRDEFERKTKSPTVEGQHER